MKLSNYQLLQRDKFSSTGQMYRFWAVVAGLAYPGYQIGLNTLITSFIGHNQIDTIVALVIRWGLFLVALNYVPRRKCWPCVLLAVLGATSMLVSWVMQPVILNDLLEIVNEFFTLGYWGFVYLYMLDTDEEILEVLKYVGYITVLSLIYEPFAQSTTLFQEAANSWGSSGYLTWGTRYVVGVIVLLSLVLNNKCGRFTRILTPIALIELIVIGNRGSIVVIISFFICYVAFQSKGRKEIALIILGLLICGLIYYFVNSELVYSLFLWLKSLGINSRTLTKLLDSTLVSSDQGRDFAVEMSLMQIQKNGYFGNLFGIGIGGDRYLIGKYPHQFFLEVLLQFGNLLGLVLIVTLLFGLVRAFRYANKEILSIIVPLGFIQLMFAGSFWSSCWFFFMLGYCIRWRKMDSNGMKERTN